MVVVVVVVVHIASSSSPEEILFISLFVCLLLWVFVLFGVVVCFSFLLYIKNVLLASLLLLFFCPLGLCA